MQNTEKHSNFENSKDQKNPENEAFFINFGCWPSTLVFTTVIGHTAGKNRRTIGKILPEYYPENHKTTHYAVDSMDKPIFEKTKRFTALKRKFEDYVKTIDLKSFVEREAGLSDVEIRIQAISRLRNIKPNEQTIER